MNRSLFVLVLLASSGTAALLACGDDASSPGATPTPDAAVAVQPVLDAGVLTAAAPPVSVYYGAPAKLDATGSTAPGAPTFEWSVASVPPGSTITTASLTGATSAQPEFQPDVLGVYTLNLKVAGGGQATTIPVTVTVVDPPTFYLHLESDGGPNKTMSVAVTGVIGGDAGTAVGCFPEDGGPGAAGSTYLTAVAQYGVDTWEAPAGQPSKVVLVNVIKNDDGGTNVRMYAATSTSTCASAPTILEDVATGAGTAAVGHPRISPTGMRVAYFRLGPAGTVLATSAIDGTDRREIAPALAFPDGGPAAGAAGTSGVTRPVWLGESRVAWAQTVGGAAWQVVVVDDVAGATPKTLMTCANAAPHQVAVLANGDILAAQALSGASDFGVYRYTPDATTKACGAPRDIAERADAGTGSSPDFALSPDGTRIAFLRSGAGGARAEIRTIDGAVVGVAKGAYYLGPRWVGDGRFLTYTALGSALDAGWPVGVAAAQADGGDVHAITAGSSPSVSIAMGNSFCALGRGYGSNVAAFGVLGLALVGLARRRRARG